jgi:hypothetical protein
VGLNGSVTEAAQSLITALQADDFVLAEGHLGPQVESCGGVTVYFPSPTDSVSPYYGDLRFANERGWDDFLGAYQRAIRGE